MPDIEYAIYQLPVTDPGCFRPVGRDLLATDIANLSRYKKAFSGTVRDGADLEVCEALFRSHNADDRPDAQICRSMSVSDVVVLNRSDGRVAYACDVFGFVRLPTVTHPDFNT